ARALAWEDLACGDAAGVVKTVVDARWREYVAKARTLVEAITPAIRAAALEEAALLMDRFKAAHERETAIAKSDHPDRVERHDTGACDAEDYAAAIRALKEKTGR
ncbi:MAG: hypothetical protein MUE84_15735, partial [Hyphomonas sp.]|nr:hypothetical protein [Hyphomonas sp.]